jgi:hypothetical protein
MTLKEILQGIDYEIIASKHTQEEIRSNLYFWESIRDLNTATQYQYNISRGDEITVLDKFSGQAIIKIRSFKKRPILYIRDQEQNMEKSMISHIFGEIALMYYKQEKEAERRKAEEEAAKFEQKKNAVYLDLFNAIKTNVKK